MLRVRKKTNGERCLKDIRGILFLCKMLTNAKIYLSDNTNLLGTDLKLNSFITSRRTSDLIEDLRVKVRM